MNDQLDTQSQEAMAFVFRFEVRPRLTIEIHATSEDEAVSLLPDAMNESPHILETYLTIDESALDSARITHIEPVAPTIRRFFVTEQEPLQFNPALVPSSQVFDSHKEALQRKSEMEANSTESLNVLEAIYDCVAVVQPSRSDSKTKGE